jgi:hypothetical protein
MKKVMLAVTMLALGSASFAGSPKEPLSNLLLFMGAVEVQDRRCGRFSQNSLRSC